MEESKYDDMLARILDEEKQIYPFLDALFGFLWRRTDFFVIQKEDGKLGFPPGAAEKIVRCIMNKWQTKPRMSGEFDLWTRPSNVIDFSNSVVRTEEVETCPSSKNVEDEEMKSPTKKEHKRNEEASSSDIYNGADRGTYRWAQSILDLDIQVPVSESIKKSKDVLVTVTDRLLTVKMRDGTGDSQDGWKCLVDGQLCYKVSREDTIWSLLPGQQIVIHCEKCEERWWDALLMEEPKLDTGKIDASRPITDLSEEEQMKVQEMMWNEERRQLGLKTSHEERAEKILKDAWNLEGSPFKGTEYDPEIVKIEPNTSMNL